MIMMRSTGTTRMGKPPPPVPPRPSKSVVAEALAKTRKPQIDGNNKLVTRTAPQPPLPLSPPSTVVNSSAISNGTINEIIKSKSSINVNGKLKKPVVYERSISDDIKCNNNTRPIVYQSANLKRKDSDNRKIMEVKQNENNIKDEENQQHVDEITVEDDLIEKNNKNLNITSNGKENCCNNKNGKNWDNMLNDRNHVNTLIDEMFASVLNVPGIVEDAEKDQQVIDTIKQQQDNVASSVAVAEKIVNTNAEITSLIDKTKITINNNAVMESNKQITTNDNKSHNNLSDEKLATVIIIKDGGCEPSSTTLQANSTNIIDSNNTTTVNNIETTNKSNSSTVERKKVKFDDQMNHELLIAELQSMKKDQEKILKRQRKPSMNIYDNSDNNSDVSNIQCSDWVEINGDKEINLSTCHITIEGLGNKNNNTTINAIDCKRISKMSSLHGLPPLPKSLSGFNLLENQENPPTPVRTSSIRSGQTSLTTGGGHLVYPPHPKAVNGTSIDVNQPVTGRKSTNLDTQLAILRREMYSLRQLDLSLLSQLWSLNESIQDFRQMLQEQDDRVLSPPSPSPAPSSCDEGDGDEFYMSTSSISFRPAPPPPPPIRRPSSSSNASSIHDER